VDGNESRLGQVFLNLIVNAAQAIPEGHAEANQITVTTGTENGWIVAEIRDTGPGIPPDVLAKLFTPFFTTKPAGQGTGLGLMICQRIVHGLGGQMSVESTPGEGTVFKVSLRPHHGEHREEAPRRVDRKISRRGSVLVIDDDLLIGRAVKRALDSQHHVVLLHDAKQAVAKLQAGAHFDVILCDLMMPSMTGCDFFEEIRAVRPDLVDRIVFLTGGAFTARAKSFLDDVANARMEKPFAVADLRSLVNDRMRS